MKIEHNWDKGIHVWDTGNYSVGIIRQTSGGYFWGVMKKTSKAWVEVARGGRRGGDRSQIVECRRVVVTEGWTMLRTGGACSYVMAILDAIAYAHAEHYRRRKGIASALAAENGQRIAVA